MWVIKQPFYLVGVSVKSIYPEESVWSIPSLPPVGAWIILYDTNMRNNRHKLEMTTHGVHLWKHTYRNLWDFSNPGYRV